MEKRAHIESLLGRDRWIIAACLTGVALLAWAYILAGAGMDMSMPGMVMAPMTWSPAVALLMFIMWWVMMIAMMVPSAAPTILLFAKIRASKAATDQASIGAATFLAGYLVIWGAFSALATGLQWGLERIELMAMGMRLSSPLLAGTILLTAGLYQFTPIKAACLKHCQSPVLFLSTHWRRGAAGAFLMGTRHGIYCLGCCWVLMALLFVGGIMNLLWVAGLAAYVALEKLTSGTIWLARAIGAALCGAGVVALSGAIR
ncbi:MAG: DUF2182 domain-containing protein [Hyphomicrobiaceae bacterium]|nr:MAG: DUF2182 domain-containing protein [Hyphomicrobiaceae bacterium]